MTDTEPRLKPMGLGLSILDFGIRCVIVAVKPHD